MTHFNISVSPQCVHLPICLSTVYFLSLPPCLCVVYGAWEMRHFANDTSQMNLKFRFLFFFFFLNDSYQLGDDSRACAFLQTVTA